MDGRIFRMDRGNVKFISMEKDEEANDKYWLTRSVEERFYAIEFLRHQYMEMDGIEPVMDRKYYEARS